MAQNYTRIGWNLERGVLSQIVCYKDDNDTDLRWGISCPGYRCTRSILLFDCSASLTKAENELGELGWTRLDKLWSCSSCAQADFVMNQKLS